MRDTIEWRDSEGGSMGAHKLLMVRDDYVGHLYIDASVGVNVAQVLEDIEVRYNSHAALVAALRNMVDAVELTKDDYEQAESVLRLARGCE